jgi:hypothetical protein
MELGYAAARFSVFRGVSVTICFLAAIVLLGF